MAISCIYCGAEHARADDVRACWLRNGAPGEAGDSATDTLADASTVIAAPASRWAGPDALGRSLVVRPGTEPPAPWAAAPRITLDTEVLRDLGGLLDALRTASADRQRHVFFVSDVFDALTRQVDERALHVLGARAELPIDDLLHLVWSNSVDGRDLAAARWPLAERAVSIGANAPIDLGAGDVEVPGVGACWLDGGPLRHTAPIDGIPVVPAVAIQHRSLRPYGGNVCSAALADDQLRAVTHASGCARIIAPAGSGKTRVLTERARHLVRNWQLPPSAITLVAYNRRAQREMQERLADLPGVQVRTLNALALAIVNGSAPFAPRPRSWRTVDEREVRGVLADLVQSPRRRNVDPYAPWLEALSAARLGLRDPLDVEDSYGGDVAGFAEVLAQYEAALERLGALDFDGQITAAIRLLLRDPSARVAAQHACRLLLVDEFQDLTPAHVLLIRLLGGPDADVFGVGDDDQTIYGYNGADPQWLLDYASLFHSAGAHQLEVNYRCPGDVVDAVERMLRRNKLRVAKIIRSDHHDTVGMRWEQTDDPLTATVDAVRAALAGGRAPAEIAVLTRVNVSLVPVQVALQQHGVATERAAGTEFLTRPSVRAALAWLRLATSRDGAFETEVLAEAVRRPSRQLSPRLASWVAEQSSLDGLNRLAARLDNERDASNVATFAGDLQRVRQAATRGTTHDLIGMVCDDLGLAGTLAAFDQNRRGMNTPSQGDDLLAVRHLAALHADPATFGSWLTTQLDHTQNRQTSTPNSVTLATVHRVKGQEWPVVVVHLADADQFPHRLADDIDEERRVFHVALTRTSAQLVVVSSEAVTPFRRELNIEPSSDDRQLRPAVSPRPAVTGPRTARAASNAELSPADHTLFEKLRTWRTSVRNGKPAYTVFDDATLGRIASARPTTLIDLAGVKGVGPVKLEQYGDALLSAISAAGD